jgi:uncharacterized protein YegL
MKKNYTHIAFIMDRSGSMKEMANEATAAFNSFVKEQCKLEGEATFTFVHFDHDYDVVYDFVPIQEVSDYKLVPGGTTALLDAIGRTIATIGDKLGRMQEDDRPDKVIIAILTDGDENASQEFNNERINELIKEHEEKYNWTFTYLGANQDAFAVARRFGIQTGNALNFVASPDCVVSGISTFNKAISTYRSVGYNMADKDCLLSENQANDSEML